MTKAIFILPNRFIFSDFELTFDLTISANYKSFYKEISFKTLQNRQFSSIYNCIFCERYQKYCLSCTLEFYDYFSFEA